MQSVLSAGNPVRARGLVANARCRAGGLEMPYGPVMPGFGSTPAQGQRQAMRFWPNGAVAFGAAITQPRPGQGSFSAGQHCQANGALSFAAGGSNVVSAQFGVAVGQGITVSAGQGFGAGEGHTVSGAAACALNSNGTASGTYSLASGRFALANKIGQRAHGGGAVLGRQQISDMILVADTTDATVTEALTSGSGRCLIATSTAYLATIKVIARSAAGADHRAFERRCLIYNNAGTTALEGAVQTIGTDIFSAGAATWAVTVTADNTNDALKVEVTGAAATTIRWCVEIQLTEVIH